MSDQEIPSMQEAVTEAAAPAEEAIEASNQESQETEEQTESPAAEAKATLKDPKATKSEKKAAEKQLKKLRLKVDGEEFDEEFDLNDDKYITEQLQLAKVARKRMQEKALLEKDVFQFIEELKRDPRKALSDPAFKDAIDLKKFAAQIIEDEIENSKKSPQQLEKEKLEAELKAMKEEREKEKETARQKEFERLREQEFERYDMLMSQALEKTDLPKSPYIVKKMADYMLLGLRQGKDVTPEDVIPLVREEIQDDLKAMFEVMPDEVIEKLIGKDKLNSIRKKNIAKAKQANNPALKAAAKTTDTGKTVSNENPSDKKTSFKQFFGV